MRRLRAVRASILRARFSLSAVSSSMELEAVFTSTPSFFRRSMTSWLERSRSLASWKTLTFSIRLPSLARTLPRGHRRHRLAFGLGLRLARGPRGLGRRLLLARGLALRRLGRRRRFRRRGFLGRGLLLGQAPRLLLGRRLLRGQALRLEARGLLGVALVPDHLGLGGRAADLLRGLG